MARAGIWQGIRDWLAPVERSVTPRPGSDAIQRPFGDPRQRFDDSLDATGEAASEVIAEEELLEFLASDLDPVPVDPVFRENLREELWSMMLDQGYARPKDS